MQKMLLGVLEANGVPEGNGSLIDILVRSLLRYSGQRAPGRGLGRFGRDAGAGEGSPARAAQPASSPQEDAILPPSSGVSTFGVSPLEKCLTRRSPAGC